MGAFLKRIGVRLPVVQAGMGGGLAGSELAAAFTDAGVRAIHRLTSLGAAQVPAGLQMRLAAAQRPSRPLFGPAAATADGPANLVDAGPLYAGESIARIGDGARPASSSMGSRPSSRRTCSPGRFDRRARRRRS